MRGYVSRKEPTVLQALILLRNIILLKVQNMAKFTVLNVLPKAKAAEFSSRRETKLSSTPSWLSLILQWH